MKMITLNAWRVLSASALLGLVTSGCGAQADSEPDAFVASTDEALLTGCKSTGKLSLGGSRTEELSGSNRCDGFTFIGHAGDRVHFVLKSGDFRTKLYWAKKGGKNSGQKVIAGVQNPDNGAWYAELEVVLPADGSYTLQAARANAKGTHFGQYTLSAAAVEPKTFCGGIAALPCPEGEKCLLDGDYPDAGGACVEEGACHTAADCSGPHILCVGSFSCNNISSAGVGTCEWACGSQPTFCGGIAAFPCPEGNACQLDGNYPDAGGHCVPCPMPSCAAPPQGCGYQPAPTPAGQCPTGCGTLVCDGSFNF